MRRDCSRRCTRPGWCFLNQWPAAGQYRNCLILLIIPLSSSLCYMRKHYEKESNIQLCLSLIYYMYVGGGGENLFSVTSLTNKFNKFLISVGGGDSWPLWNPSPSAHCTWIRSEWFPCYHMKMCRHLEFPIPIVGGGSI